MARRLGLLDPDERLAVEQVPIPEPALCLAFGVHGEVRLCCTEGRGHAGAHSWVRAMVGKSACIAATKIGASGEWLCQRPSGHAGEHKASTPDGARWTWGDAPTVPPCRCGLDACNGEPGHKLSPLTPSGHLRCPAMHADGVTRCHDNAGHSAMEHGGTGPHGPKTWARNVVTDPTEPRAS